MFGNSKNKKDSLSDDIKAIVRSLSGVFYDVNDFAQVSAFKALQKRSKDERKLLVIGLLNHAFQFRKVATKHSSYHITQDATVIRVAELIARCLLRNKLDYNEQEWIELFKSIEHIKNELSKKKENPFHLCLLPITYVIKQLEYRNKKNPITNETKAYIRDILNWEEFIHPNNYYYRGSDMKKSKSKLEALAGVEEAVGQFTYKSEDIADEVNNIVSKINKNRNEYTQLFKILLKVSGSKPSKKIANQFDELIGAIGNSQYKKTLHKLLEIPTHRNHTDSYKEDPIYYKVDYYLCSSSQNFIKGLAWTSARYSDKVTIKFLSQITEKSYTKIPGKGPAAAALGNACVYALGNMRGKDGLGALSRLKLKVRQNNVKKTIDNYMLAGAKKYNVSVEELKEMAVPDFGLSDGVKEHKFEDYTLQITIAGIKVNQQWIKPDGSQMKSIPSLIKNKERHKKKLQAIRKEVKEIQKVFSAQKQRIDNQFILDREWDYVSFKKYYLEHGLVSPITKKLIWSFTNNGKSTEAIFKDEKWITEKNEFIDWIEDNTTVKLWHPVNAKEQQIVDWREKIMNIELKQPLKQAFREIYILTDAEINTGTYSNRMAAHILKQHQFNSLASIRDWKYSLIGSYDDGRDNEICYRVLQEHEMRAEFWIDEMIQEDHAINDAGIWLYVATDQVKFLNAKNESIDLIDFPKIIFSEIMRDVDLFVGVASVGNDPLWMDNNGVRQSKRDYWHGYSFGDLSEIAKTRKTILERILPRLKKIRNVSRIEGKFLIVKGKRRTYKIHIGSGNILMEPDDQYLCIVPSRSAGNTTQKLFIPFEGDRGLSIVLSKAFLLAEDEKITDPVINNQINRT